MYVRYLCMLFKHTYIIHYELQTYTTSFSPACLILYNGYAHISTVCLRTDLYFVCPQFSICPQQTQRRFYALATCLRFSTPTCYNRTASKYIKYQPHEKPWEHLSFRKCECIRNKINSSKCRILSIT